jgi:hypothetical protein
MGKIRERKSKEGAESEGRKMGRRDKQRIQIENQIKRKQK